MNQNPTHTAFTWKTWLLSVVLVISTLGLYLSTFSNSLMFDDAAEFALVIRLGSIAHPPGFPSYILSGIIWDRLTEFIWEDTIFRITLFSAVCVSLGVLFLFWAFRYVSANITSSVDSWQSELSAFFAALIFATGNTTWAWANTIEAYAFQILAMGIVLWGLASYHAHRKNTWLLVAAFGLALGWGNHHLTMIAFTPFVPLFFIHGLFENNAIKKQKKSSFILGELIEILRSKTFLYFIALASFFTLCFYAWMFWRAQQEYYFMFGKPDNLELLFYHIRGGVYTKNITQTTQDISAVRLPYFLKLTAQQFFIFLPFLISGIWLGVKKNIRPLVIGIIIYYLILLAYQLRNNQWSSTDAYMLLPFMALSLALVISISHFFKKLRLVYILPILLVVTIIWEYKYHDRKTYPVSEDLMMLLDRSAPKNSVVLISDWSTIIQYYFYRYEKNFRPDLDVLNYDFKFTHYRMVPNNNPKLYAAIQKEYDAFVEELKKTQPFNAVNTGCNLEFPQVKMAYKNLLNKIELVCKEKNRTFLTDPKAHFTYTTNGFYTSGQYVAGCFSAGSFCDTSYSTVFLNLNLPFLNSPLLRHDPSCLDKMVDFQAMLDQHIRFYSANQMNAHLQRAQAAKQKIMAIQKELKKSMSFAFTVQGK
ncbi:MAG: DUF2723 domain-containing protein [Flavobacteriales bacterium]|nr:DUF2723 domain-containing protein [Flavobacteriales bacterium]